MMREATAIREGRNGRESPPEDPAMAVEIDPAELPERIAALPGTGRLREAAADSAHLVGGAVRDLLMGRDRVVVDVVVEGDAIALARELDPAAVVHERFGTATVMLDGLSVDLA